MLRKLVVGYYIKKDGYLLNREKEARDIYVRWVLISQSDEGNPWLLSVRSG